VGAPATCALRRKWQRRKRSERHLNNPANGCLAAKRHHRRCRQHSIQQRLRGLLHLPNHKIRIRHQKRNNQRHTRPNNRSDHKPLADPLTLATHAHTRSHNRNHRHRNSHNSLSAPKVPILSHDRGRLRKSQFWIACYLKTYKFG
jgi:hypothetical protein